MVHLLVMFSRKPGISVEEFQKYWHEKHLPIAKKIPGVKKYVICLPHESEYADKTPVHDGVAELWFESAEACGQGLQSPEGQAAFQDLANFAEENHIGTLLSRDEFII